MRTILSSPQQIDLNIQQRHLKAIKAWNTRFLLLGQLKGLINYDLQNRLKLECSTVARADLYFASTLNTKQTCICITRSQPDTEFCQARFLQCTKPKFFYSCSRTLRHHHVPLKSDYSTMSPNINLLLISLLLATLFLQKLAKAQQQQPEGEDKNQFKPLQPGSPEDKRRQRANCDLNFRSQDGTCTNPKGRKKKLWGSTNRAQFSYFGRFTSSVKVNGKRLKSAREISNILFRSSTDVFDPRGLNEFATFFGQFIDHTIVATPSDNSEDAKFDIEVKPDDPIFGNFTACGKNVGNKSKLNFNRSIRVHISRKRPEERPQNSLTSSLDLCSVYGPSKRRNNGLRGGNRGLMETSAGDLPPLNSKGFSNAPNASSPSFFLTGDHRANEHPVLTALHTIFLREHNSLAVELREKFPKWSDRLLFETARKINGAQFQKIVYKDWYPSIAGSALPKYRGFKRKVDLSVSVLFSTAAFRVGHTMVGNEIKRKGPRNKDLPSLPFCDMFFNVVSLFQVQGNLETFVRGALGNFAQKVDVQVRDALRNFLFEKVDGEDGFDLVAMNIQRGRDHALPKYNKACKRFGITAATSFEAITKNKIVQSNLANAYGTVEKVEAWPGMLAEDLTSESSLPPCIQAIWEEEFKRIRDGDFFYYENGEQFDSEVTDAIPRIGQLFDDNVDTLKEIVLRNTDIKPNELPKRMFFKDS